MRKDSLLPSWTSKELDLLFYMLLKKPTFILKSIVLLLCTVDQAWDFSDFA